ncbi:ribonuclease HIII [Ornithinibacillus massiliensis]|uniref:Ribonuclease HIII n=1 Tax=Ornithinibacillus massiliensis TaxID=1944633 RepID=A0ABS5MAP0_9BACI|nr:ribonuclease HIII [Ornithinibacillus massiliensis]MBS3679392.1 ribonuclease HIII [Ornithinibacillus massiliensis]
MSQNVLLLTNEVMEKMKQYYHKSLTTTPQGAVFRAKTSNVVITAYKSGKVLFQGKHANEEMDKWSDQSNVVESKNPKHSKSSSNTLYTPPDTLFTASHIGSDEAGTGDYFGPITVASAFISSSQISLLKEIGVKDSKNLTDEKIIQLAKEIAKMRIPYSLLILHNQKYNSLQKKGWSQGKMKAMLHHHAIRNLLTKIVSTPYEGILIDQFCEPIVYKKHIASEQGQLPNKTYFMTKAESYSIAVAAASIIARASFVKEMDKLSEQVGIELRKGASKLVDQTIARIIREQGEDVLQTCAKVHFANTQKARQYLS